MRRAELCNVCGLPAEKRCRSCGRMFCRKDFDEASGMCGSCRRGRQMKSA